MSESPPTPPAGDGERYADGARRYRLDSRIATGGMGEVWRATDTVLGREVAVKLLKPEYADDATFRSRFETEARHAASLHHPGIAGVFDFGESRAGEGPGPGLPHPYLVMELVDGQPLSALLRPGQPLADDAVRDLLAQAGDAIGAAHRAGIVHRDVKPANLLITSDRKVKVTDFGIARAVDAAEGATVTQTGQVMGTPQYLSPEQARGEPVTPASDVYALGVVAFECLAGRRPFEAGSPVATALAHLQQPVPELPDSVPADLAGIVRRALSKDPAERFADGTAFAAALRDPSSVAGDEATGATQVLAPAPVAAAPGPPVERLAPASAYEGEPAEEADDKGGRRKVWPVVLLVALLVAALALVGYLVFGSDGEESGDDTVETTSSSARGDRTVQLDADDYVGREVDVVQQELLDRGFRVQLSEADNPGDEPAGIVSGIDPSGTVERRALITVTYWGAPPETSEPPPSTPTESSEPPETSSPPPSSSTPPSTSAPPSTSVPTPSQASSSAANKTRGASPTTPGQ